MIFLRTSPPHPSITAAGIFDVRIPNGANSVQWTRGLGLSSRGRATERHSGRARPNGTTGRACLVPVDLNVALDLMAAAGVH